LRYSFFRFLFVAHGYLQTDLKSFEQVASDGHVTASFQLALDYLAPIGDEPLALGNAATDLLQTSTQRV
jgi:hypothetical protein